MFFLASTATMMLASCSLFKGDSPTSPVTEDILSMDSGSSMENAKSAAFQCSGAPFIAPTWGWQQTFWRQPISYVSADGDRLHDGIDLAQVNNQEGVEPVYAVCNGTLNPISKYSFRILCDTIDARFNVPNRNVYVYYTHMANKSGSTSYILTPFRGSSSVRVSQGQHLGYQGSYGVSKYVHLHFSVNSQWGERYNIDPSRYFGTALDYQSGARATGKTPPFSCSLSQPQTAAPIITGVSPNPFPRALNWEKRILMVSGQNFQQGAKLEFKISGTSYVYPDRVPVFVNNNTLTYNISVGPTVYTWTVQVINPDGRRSNLYTFYVK